MEIAIWKLGSHESFLICIKANLASVKTNSWQKLHKINFIDFICVKELKILFWNMF